MKVVKVSLFLLISIIAAVGFSQNNGKMITHIIKPGETISSLSRIYHVKKDDIFKLNNLNDRTVLHIGQKIIVPTGKSTPTVVAAPVAAPVITNKVPTQNFDKNKHLVVSGDNLSRIAKQYKVSEQQLKDWNGLKNDVIRAGSYLIISGTDGTEKPPVVKTEVKPVIKETKPVVVDEVKPVVVEPTKKVEPVVAATPAIKPAVVEQQPMPSVKTPTPKNDFFEKQFVSSQNSVEGLSGTFKTIAGWQDKKYYVLLSNVQSGSIVKISANNKAVYAKVLGPLPNVKEDNNLALRVSNATAAALGVTENKFSARVEF